MAESFGNLKLEMETACEFLRSFTLGRQGFTRQDGVAAIGRVSDLCAQMQEQFGAGSHAGEVASTVVMARNQIMNGCVTGNCRAWIFEKIPKIVCLPEPGSM